MRYGILIALFVLTAIFFISFKKGGSLPVAGGTGGGSKGMYQKISPKEVKEKIEEKKKFQLVDVRTKGEYDAGHIKGAILIPLDTIGTQPPKKLSDKDAEIIVYCRSGSRSKQAAKKLLGLGYTNVLDMGGLMRWPYDVVK